MAPIETTLILAGSFGLGVSHAFEADHLAAVGAFVAARPSPGRALGFGVKWAAGHGLSLLVFGLVLFLLRAAVPPGAAAWLDRAVGLAVLALGARTLHRLLSRGIAPAHVHDSGSSGPLWMGILHGLAGTAAFIGQLVIVSFGGSFGAVSGASRDLSFVVAYTLAFSLGVMCAMALVARVLGGLLADREGSAFRAFMSRNGRLLTALGACAVGTFWALR